MNERRIVRLTELSRVLQVSPASLSRWASKGTIPCLRGPRTLRFDLEAVLDALRHRTDAEVESR